MSAPIYYWILASLFILIKSHPQCLDKFPPFSINGDDVFCHQYRKYGCCTVAKNNQLLMRYRDIIQKMNLPSTCSDTVKDLICQECSPYAAQLFQTQGSSNILRVCNNFCRKISETCKNSINKYLTTNLNAGKCNTVNAGAPDHKYCYPDILQNRELNEAIKSRQTTSSSDCLCLKELDGNLEKPLILLSPDDGTKRIFLGTQTGIINIYRNGTKLPETFMDISDAVHTSSFRGDHRGLLGMAFHSNFKKMQKFYLHYTVHNMYGDNKLVSRITEFRTLQNNRNKADIGTSRTIIDIEQPSSLHNGGQLIFGTDGYLYVFLGDGQKDNEKGIADPLNKAQNRSSLLGKILRLDVDNTSEQKQYAIPPDNPFVHQSGVRPEIFAYGFKNPMRGDEDEGDPETGYGKGRIFVGDVGHNSWEEINLVKKGGNYGWSIKEGDDCYKKELCNKFSDIHPIYMYHHNSSDGHVIIGGHVYRGCLNPSLNGMYIYGDYATGKLFRLKETGSSWDYKELQMCENCPQGLSNKYHSHIMGFGEDFDGEIYIISNDGTGKSGSVHKIVDPKRRGDPETCRSNRKSASLIDIEVDKVKEKQVMPKWAYWLMALSSIMGFISGIMTVYALIRYCPKWGSYRRLLHIHTVSDHRRSDQHLNTIINDPHSGL